MRLLVAHQRLGDQGGAEAAVFVSAEALAARGHTVGLLHRETTGRNENAWRSVFGLMSSPASSPEAVRQAVQALQPDRIFLHGWEDTETLQALADCGLPVVRMVHDHSSYCLRSYRYHPISRKVCTRPAGAACVFPCLAPLQRNRGRGLPFVWASLGNKLREVRICRGLTLQLAVSRHIRDQLLINGFPAERIRICWPVPPEPRSLARLSPKPSPTIVFAGQIVRGKGLDALLRAFSQLPETARLLVLGDGPQRAACERLARRLNLGSRVHFAGYLPREDLERHYGDAAAVAVPSLWPEPFGLVGIEAMRRGLPVVAFDTGGIRDWLRDGETGLIAPWGDVIAFGRHLRTLLDQPETARRLGEAAQAAARRTFGFDSFIDRLEDHLLHPESCQ